MKMNKAMLEKSLNKFRQTYVGQCDDRVLRCAIQFGADEIWEQKKKVFEEQLEEMYAYFENEKAIKKGEL